MAKRKRKQSVKARAIEKNLYETYSKAYDRSAKAMAKRGEAMYTRKLSPREFENTYQTYIWDARAEIRQGRKKTTGNVVLTMVSDQRYETTKDQATSLYEAAYKFEHECDTVGMKLTQKMYDDIRAGKNETVETFKSFLTEYNEDLKKQGLNSYDRRKLISQTWFGSP